MNARLLASIPLALALALGGCASDDADVGPAAESEVVAGPITLQNYVNHPTITAIRNEVRQIDGAGLREETNPGCDGQNTKWSDPSGKIRKLKEIGGEGGFEGESTAYYRPDGKLLFLFNKQTDHTGSQPDSTELRVYFDAQGRVIFQVARNNAGADSIPAEPFEPAYYADPKTWFEYTACGGDGDGDGDGDGEGEGEGEGRGG